MLGVKTNLIRYNDPMLDKTTTIQANKIFKGIYEAIEHEANMTWRDNPSRYLDGKVQLWHKVKERFDDTMGNEIAYLRREQKKKINSFCVRCGHYKCGKHCNFGDCGQDIMFYKDGMYLMSDFDDMKHYPANTNGTPHLLCTFKDEMPYDEWHQRVIAEERKLKLRWRVDPRK